MSAFLSECCPPCVGTRNDRYDTRSSLIASQLPVELWHEAIGDPTLADAILDRLVHNAYRLDIKGESMRKARGIPQLER